jgi:hypothetical protein
MIGIVIFLFFSNTCCANKESGITKRDINRSALNSVAESISENDNLYENCWVVKVDLVKKEISIQTVVKKINIVFGADDDTIAFMKRRVGWIVPVSFECEKKDDKCDFDKPYTMLVTRRKVEPLIVRKNQK